MKCYMIEGVFGTFLIVRHTDGVVEVVAYILDTELM